MNILMRRPWPKDARFFSARIVGFVLPPSAAAPIKALRRDLRPLSKSPCVVTLMAMGAERSPAGDVSAQTDEGHRASHPPQGRNLSTLPPGLGRRFEAVVLWSATSVISPGTAKGLMALCEAGALVGVLAPAPVHELARQLSSPFTSAAALLLADSAAAETGSDTPRWSQTKEELAALDQAGRDLTEALAGLELAANVLRRPAGSPKVSVELIQDSGLRSTGPRLKQLLLDHGIPSVSSLAELATEAALRAGLVDPRVVVEGSKVEIALRDAGDVAVEMFEELWRRGVDPETALVVLDGLTGVPHRPATVIDPDVRSATVVLVNGGRGSPPSGVLALTGGATRLRQLLADQLRRRRQRALPAATTRAGWSLVLEGDDPENEHVHEALLTLADGHVGSSGAPLAVDPSRRPWVIAAGVYTGDGAATHLLTGPIAFALGEKTAEVPLQRTIDLRTGVVHERVGAETDLVESVRFMSKARPTTAALRVRYPAALRSGPPLRPPTDDLTHDRGRVGDTTWIRVAGSNGGIVAAASQTRLAGRRPMDGTDARDRVLDRVAVYRCDAETLPDPLPAVETLGQTAKIGFDRLLAEHRHAWARRWEDADVVVEGDDELQLGIRFALFHLMASVADTGEAAVGARGLTGTGYSGHVFWDADTFVLPFLAATHPASARAMLEYRLRRLPAALEAARAAGRAGARFPWESGHSGADVTPKSARDRSGRLVPIRTGQLEEHIVAQVPWAACCYVDWSGDEEFARGPGRRILVETARYWASRIRIEPDGSAHIYGVVGPDEYHEPVDDNAFTNVMARWNLRRAAEAAGDAEAAEPSVGDDERHRWLELADALFDGYDADTGIYEQFAGFHQLEPLIIAEAAPRRPIAADLLLGAERTSNAQVIKQADVLMLHHLLPDEVMAGSLEPNLRYYEQRTAHGSSLSPAIHASVLARARDFDPALRALRIAARMDLDDLTGSTAAGLHLATMGGTWQALAFGFAGLRPHSGALHVDPVLPPSWSAFELRVRFHGSRVRIRKERAHLSIWADRRISVVVGSTPFVTGPGKQDFRRHGSNWELIS
jgi:trehalose/maltose hydrolase-like predicted phosphorylase